MTTTQLIRQLQELEAKHGPMPVRIMPPTHHRGGAVVCAEMDTDCLCPDGPLPVGIPPRKATTEL